MQNKSFARLSQLIEQLESRRLLSAGGLDTSFSGDGKATAGPGVGGANGMAVQSDGKIVEVGERTITSGGAFVDEDVELVRYNANGTLDTSFGSSHKGTVDFHYNSSGDNDQAEAVAIQADGKIVVAAADFGTNGLKGPTFDIFRFNSNGSMDQSFGSKGKVNVDMGFLHAGYPAAVAIQKDGKILISGTQESEATQRSDFVLVRLNPNGSLDNTFGNATIAGSRTGVTTVDFQTDDTNYGMTIDYNDTVATNPDYGKIVICGGGSGRDDKSKVLVARFNANGILDSSFAGDGTRTDTLPGESSIDAEAVTIQGDGYVVIAGSYGSTDLDPDDGKGFLLMEYTPNGSLNMGFGSGGVVKTPIAAKTTASSVINGFSQRLIVGGAINSGPGGFALAAYTVDGKLDPAFGKAGIETTSYAEGNNAVHAALALGPNRTIVAAAGADFGTARFFDVGPTVSVSSLDTTAGPTTLKRVGKFNVLVLNPASLIVSRDQRLPFATRVYFTIGGSANVPNLNDDKRGIDGYTLSGMTVEKSPLTSKIAYVDIPANETFTTVTLTPENIPANNTTATFTINSQALYDKASPTNQVITILGTHPQPVTTVLKDTADAYVRDGSSANTNFGTATQLVVKKSGTTGDNRQAYLKFDLSSLTMTDTVKLNLFGALNVTGQNNIVTQLFSVANNSWTETGITFNNEPAAGASPIASATILDTTQRTYTFDVTTYVKQQLALGNKTVSFVLKNPSNSGPAFIFNSREAASNQPALTVT